MERVKRMVITYHMERDMETAEDALAVEMPWKAAEELEAGARDSMAKTNMYSHASLMVHALAKLRGYRAGYIADVREEREK